MKIIKPLDNLKDIVSSNAPGDGYALWQTVGRDFLASINSLAITCNQTTLFAVDAAPSFTKQLYAFDLATGSAVALTFPLSNFYIRALAASPDGQFLAINGYQTSTGNPRFRIYNLATGSMLVDDVSNDAYSNVPVWSSDSQVCAFVYGSNPILWVAGQWSAVTLDTSVVKAMYEENPPEKYAGGHYMEGFCADDTGIYYSISTTEWYTEAGRVKGIEKSILGKMSTTGGNNYVTRDRQQGILSSIGIDAPKHLIYNAKKQHILSWMDGGFYAFNGSTLAQDTDVPQLSGIEITSISQALDSSEIAYTNQSVQPFLRRVDGTTYTGLGDLDSETGGYTDTVRYSSDYIAFEDSGGGYGLIDKSTGARVTQVNPSVTKGDIYTYGNHNYRALVDSNDRPDIGEQSDPPTWLNLGFINALRMTDGRVGTYTKAGGALEITLTSDTLIDGVALFGVRATSVQVRLFDGQTLVYDAGQVSLRDSSAIDGWYSHFFRRRGVKNAYVLTALPPYRGASIQITLTALDGESRLGDLVAGQVRKIGDLLFGVKVGAISFSRKERDAFGVFDIIKRDGSKRAEYPVSIRSNQLAWIQELLASLDATAIAYIGAESRRETIIYGLYRSFDIILEGPVYSDCNIEVEEII